MARGTMKLVNPYTGLMECRVCGHRHTANLKAAGKYYRGSWQCSNAVCPTRTEKQRTASN